MRDIDREHRYRGRPEVRVCEILDDRVALPRERDSSRLVVPLRVAASQLDGVIGSPLKPLSPVGSHQPVLQWLSAIPDGLKILALEGQSQCGHQRPNQSQRSGAGTLTASVAVSMAEPSACAPIRAEHSALDSRCTGTLFSLALAGTDMHSAR